MAGVKGRLLPPAWPPASQGKGARQGHPRLLSLIGPLWPRDLKGPGEGEGQVALASRLRPRQFQAPSFSLEPLSQAENRTGWT